MQDNMKKAAGIFLYNTTIEDADNLNYYAGIFDCLYLYLNSPLSDEVKSILNKSDNIRLLGNGNNDGLCVASNQICSKAFDDGVEWILFLDQDSRITTDAIDSLYSYAAGNTSSTNMVALICPRIIIGANSSDADSPEEEDVEWCITSGSLFNLRVYKTQFSFDESYFIDRVDRDICKQIRDFGYRIVRLNYIILHQQLGTTVSRWGTSYCSHNYIRHYYIFRNRLYYNRKYHVSRVRTAIQLLRHIYEVILFEKDKFRVLKYIRKGWIDYNNDRMGKIEI